MTRLVSNFHLKILSRISSLPAFLQQVTTLACSLYTSLASSLDAAGGDFESLTDDWKSEAFDTLLECMVLACEDPFLVLPANAGTLKLVQSTTQALYKCYVESRVRMSKCEERYYVSVGEELDEVREEISGVDLKEQMVNVAGVGRLSLGESLGFLERQLCGSTLNNLKALWGGAAVDEGEAVALLEEARLIVMCCRHLLCDDASGETPTIPESIMSATSENPAVAGSIQNVVSGLMGLAEFQASRIAAGQGFLSPILAQELLAFFHSFVSAYVVPDPSLYDSSLLSSSGFASGLFGTEAAAKSFVEFSATLCCHYFCFWQQERLVFDAGTGVLMVIATSKQLRRLLPQSAAWSKLGWIVGGSASASMLLSPAAPAPGADAMAEGFKRVGYGPRSDVLSVLICSCGGLSDAASQGLMAGLLGVVEGLLNQLQPGDEDAAELVVELFGGVGRAPFVEMGGEGSENGGGGGGGGGGLYDLESYIVTRFVVSALPKLAALMEAFGKTNMRIVCSLLKVFRDFSERWIAFLGDAECRVLYDSCNVLLRSYCALQSSGARGVVAVAEGEDEEQGYIDVLNCIELLTHLGTKDFMSVCDNTLTGGHEAVDVTDVIFYGISQIVPLMSKLLGYPKICRQFFELVGYVVDSYPEKLQQLPPDFVESLIESLLWGITHLDVGVGKNCLRGLESVGKEHLKTKSLAGLLQAKPDLFKKCIQKVLNDVVFDNTVVFDRIDNCGACLMVLIAIDLDFFGGFVRDYVAKLGASLLEDGGGQAGGGGGGVVQQQQQQLLAGFESLVVVETINNGIFGKGVVMRNARNSFKQSFEGFVKGLHAFITCM